MRNLVIWIIMGIGGLIFYEHYLQGGVIEQTRDIYLQQFDSNDHVVQDIRESRYQYNHYILFAGITWIVGLFYLVGTTWRNYMKRKIFLRSMGITTVALLALFNAGCYQPFQPIDLKTIGTNEEGFLIPLQGDVKKQTSTNNEEFLKSNLVSTKQVQIPQQWVQLDYNTWFTWSGEWRPAATLITVDKTPITRIWTAEKNSGTSAQDEAIWVMTADQVEFSTGWVITARIPDRDSAVKFLHNYPNGSLKDVLDHEVRAKLQALFGLETTDLPMDELRKNATPHISKVVQEVDKFFSERGILITNLGISGGFVYKNSSIQDQLVKVFNAEQEKNLAIAATQAQTEQNKKIQLAAEAEAKSVLTRAKAEADAIKAVADAKAYEIQKAKEDLTTYLSLKRIELETKRLERWNGVFPQYFIGSDRPDMLLNMPVEKAVK